jgi:hypothetical protein
VRFRIRIFVVGFALTFCLYGQKKGFDFGEACFKNPSLPYCPMRDFVIKPPKDGAGSASGYKVGQAMPTTIDATGIDWRFADPSADILAAFNCSKLSASPFAHSVIDQLASTHGFNPAEAQKIFRALSEVKQVALSVRGDAIVLLATGRPSDAILPALDAGWKSVPAGENALLIGYAVAVDQASQRLSKYDVLGELPEAAQQRPAGIEFWAVASADLVGQEAVAAGVKRFGLRGSMSDRLMGDTVFEFAGGPDPAASRAWLGTLDDAIIEDNVVRAKLLIDADEARRILTKIATNPLGQGLGAFVQAVRYLPVRDTATTVHTKPVIYGLDGGPKEVK